MPEDVYPVRAIAHVVGGRDDPTDDYWGDVEATIRLHDEFPVETLQGIDEFSHLVVIWHFHRASPDDVALHARSPRNNPQWPATGTFVHRNHRRPNQLAVSFPRLLHVDGRELHVTDLDAIAGTPVLDLAPYFQTMAPRGAITEPVWPKEMLANYWVTPNPNDQ